MQTPASSPSRRHGAVDPALLRLLLLALGLLLAIQVGTSLFDFDYPGSDPYARARVKIKLGKLDEAERIYRVRILASPDDARGWLALGDLLLLRGRPELEDEAAQDYQCAAFGPHGTPAPELAAQAERVVALRQGGLLAGLRGQRPLSQRLLEQATACGDPAALRATALVDVVQGRPGADQVLQQALMSTPGDLALQLCVAAGWRRSGHAQRAHQVLAMLEQHPQLLNAHDPWQLYGEARYLAACGDQAGAAAALVQAQSGVIDAAHLERALPLDRAMVLADPAFQSAGAPLAAVLRGWSEHAPWETRDLPAPASAAPASAR